MSDKKIAETTVAKFDFGANGNIELTHSRLLASLKGETTIASYSGVKTGSGMDEEMRIKLDQLKNFGILPRKSWLETLTFFMGLWSIPLIFPFVGLVVGHWLGAPTFGFWLGFLACILALIWVIRKTPMILKKYRCAYLIFSSPDGSNVSIPFEVSRMPEVEAFAQTVKKTQSVYVDSI